jgi:FHA domain
MQVGDKSASALAIHAQMWAGFRQTPGRARNESSLTVTLTPKSGDSRLDIFGISKFPFLISNATFSRHKGEHGHELGKLSPLHACISQKGGQAYIEDLGSSHGTFVDGVRLREHAVPLRDGVVIAFGGKHFVYEVSIARQSCTETAQGGASPAEREANVPQAYDKTMFMAAPSTFLQVFCEVDEPKHEVVAPAATAVATTSVKEVAVPRRPVGRVRLLFTELVAIAASGDRDKARRQWWSAAAVACVLCALAATAYLWNSSERDLEEAFATGQYTRAADLAYRLLEKHPDDGELQARATEATLKANVPAWLSKVRAGDFGAASGVLTGMSEVAKRDADLRPLIGELEWLGDLEHLISSRGGPAAPIRIYADEERIGRLIERWNDDTGEHQRALDRIASHVPQFGDWYGETLTHLRRLQSESSVYLPVIERLEANISTELARDDADALQPVLKEAAEKYPGLGGLDDVRQELGRYIEIRKEARTRALGRLFALVRQARFVTPAFQRSLRELTESGQLPATELVQQYEVATQAWKVGHSSESFAVLQKLASGPWGEDATRELERRQAVLARFTAIHQSRNATDFVDQLLAFRTSLDAEEDVYFVRATVADLNQQKDALAARARDDVNRASRLWQEYRSDGAIDASQRVETSISDQFRSRARSLAEANRYAQQGFLIYSQIDASRAAQWAAMRGEIESEARQQRSKLEDLSRVVAPELLRTKLALLGEPQE